MFACSDVRPRQTIFPKNSLLTKEHWHNCDPWRKRVCYLYVCRLHLQEKNYRHWNNFRWEDYFNRLQLNKTFDARHLPITDGTTPLDPKNLPDPKSWLVPPMPSYRAPVRRKKKPLSRGKKIMPRQSLMWDPRTEKWVQNTMGTESAGEDTSCALLSQRKVTPIKKKASGNRSRKKPSKRD